jgi:pyruvate dehydrogenase E1 component beta subunit
VVRAGEHVTVVATQLMRHRALEAAESLAGKGVSVELIDPRTLVPFDFPTIADSVDRTNHLHVAQEAPAGGSWGATLISRIAAERFEMLDAPPTLVAPPDTPVPYAGALEDAWLPDAEKIAAAVEASLAY